ncbi:uncharacterized protein LOC105233708 [Bactrocera dorsalis]|uniref:ATP-dependent DNA helicase n=1 Tax=Bactrocera dorsalis TaxID=27457 RepID=A0A6I9VQX0_BACDO|nr:uncharacterized protein LOC105233708 [Bactrocera dorsalis]
MLGISPLKENKFVNGSEISAQEAAYNILGLHLSEESNREIFINTSQPNNRVRMLKPRRELDALQENSTDIYVPSVLDHYSQRPDQLEELCLADFAAWFRFSKTSRNISFNNEDYDEVENEDDTTAAPPMALKDGSGFLRKRKQALILRWKRFSVENSRADFFRETAMMFHPWRNKEAELLSNDVESVCNAHKDQIEQNKLKYNKFLSNELLENLHVSAEEIADERAASQLLDPEFRALAVPEQVGDVNVFHEDNNSVEEAVRLIKLPPLILEGDLLAMVQSLNNKQREYFAHVMHNVSKKKIFYEYVRGGAGVGKTLLITTIYQSLTLRANSVPGTNPETAKVLFCAPTGKAAFGIGGLTLHSVFSLPVNQSSADLRPLNSDTLNTIHANLIDIRLIIIDAISMVGAKMFSYLHCRLKQIFRSSAYFGGIPIIVFGDLKQLPSMDICAEWQ